MRAMSLWQPWASLVAYNVKTIETRGRRSPWHKAVGTTIAIASTLRPADLGDYAGGRAIINGIGQSMFMLDEPFTEEDQIARGLPPDGDLCGFPMPLGAIVALAEVEAVLPVTDAWNTGSIVTVVSRDDRADELAIRRDGSITFCSDQVPYGQFGLGRWAIVFGTIEPVWPPVPCHGKQGLWSVPDDIAAHLASETLA